VLDAKPDLVTIEFVNDVPFDRALLQENYSRILGSLRGLGAEVILITPHFTAVPAPWMGATDVRTPEIRPYVQFIYDFAKANNLAVADASARWAHLWREGIPYMTLLNNSVNHPNDLGHQMFADELVKCFGE
jgi:lysophospholipase L1-like esterase